MTARGLTLLETLAAVALLALAASALAVSLGGATDAERLAALRAELLDLDARARLLARSAGGAVLSLEDDGARLRVAAPAVAEPALRRALPRPWTLRLERRAGEAEGAVAYDARGRCPDYAFIIATPAGEHRIPVAGLTGCPLPSEDA